MDCALLEGGNTRNLSPESQEASLKTTTVTTCDWVKRRALLEGGNTQFRRRHVYTYEDVSESHILYRQRQLRHCN